ncbi:MAG: SGNH/GDSL hydrolase family protein [Kiritimatiellae bacterium]|nr:SGNH/GDSL hydrolase family protein [Kiritimatiellia bacterium]
MHNDPIVTPSRAQRPNGEPTNADEAALQAKYGDKLKLADYAAYRRLVGTLPPEEQAWERVLEAQLGNFYFPWHVSERLAGTENAWAFVRDDPALPRALLIGDSISRGYTLAARKALAGKVNLHRAPANCGPTQMGLDNIEVWLGDGRWDLIHFNFGIHDRRTDPAVYAANLETLVARLRRTGARLVWARTTPAPPPGDLEIFTAEECDRVNRVADEVMRKHGIPLDDLHAGILPHLAEMQNPNDVHFKEAGYAFMGRLVAHAILDALKEAPVE